MYVRCYQQRVNILNATHSLEDLEGFPEEEY